ncbi:hypothetical protein GCM10023185_02320 [Hymenobacter saemangeumensis]|uniref:Transglutaminase-like domain-containing protein n=1 Tax=Hymenobacter saemangeumensis TaxID=1084522 RepID=A0ABP8HY45_9BACT
MKRMCHILGAVLSLLPAVGRSQALPTAGYASLDRFARELPDAQAATVTQLAASLAAQACTDEEKARLIFAWLATHVAYDTAFLRGETGPGHTPAQVLAGRRAICQGYADLFTALATAMQLPARTVSGYGRTSDQPDPLAGKAPNHAWNVYQAGGTWHLADATWGAGSVDDKLAFTQGFNPFWFDTPPAAAIFSHLPTEPKWQLLPQPATSAEFRGWGCVSSVWFELGLDGTYLRRVLAPRGRFRAGPLPEVFATPYPVGLVRVPRRARLVSGEPVEFVFRAPPGVELSLEMDWRSVPFRDSAGYRRAFFVADVRDAKKIGVVIGQKNDAHSRKYLLRYSVEPAARAAQLASADTTGYLRR